VADHTHDIVVVTEAGGDGEYDYCRTCPYRSESRPATSHLAPETVEGDEN